MFEYMHTVLNGLKAWVTGEVNKLLSKIDAAGAAASMAFNVAAKNKKNIAVLSNSLHRVEDSAETAKSTANAAQTTANAALERVVEPYTRNAQMAPLYKNGRFSDWRSVVQEISYNETEGYFFADVFNITALKEEDMPNAVFCTDVYVERRTAKAFLSRFVTGHSLDSWSVSGFAIITDDYSRSGEILYVSANTISLNEAKGLFLTFRAPDSMLLKSSTINSTKKFKITVDDTGALSAVEVTT